MPRCPNYQESHRWNDRLGHEQCPWCNGTEWISPDDYEEFYRVNSEFLQGEDGYADPEWRKRRKDNRLRALDSDEDDGDEYGDSSGGGCPMAILKIAIVVGFFIGGINVLA